MKQGLVMKYFVLKPSMKDAYGKASIAAMRKYSGEISETNIDLDCEILDWVDDISNEHFNQLTDIRKRFEETR